MARKSDWRLVMRGELVAMTPLHVGGHGDSLDTDLPLARNGKGQFYIPGTGIAGALRNWCEAIDSHLTRRLWGFQDETAEREEDQGRASEVFVEDSAIDEVTTEIRDGVGIDRYSGTAAEQIKFDRAILPRGTRLRLELTLECADHQAEAARKLFASLQHALENQRIRIGAAKSRGLGKLKLENGTFKQWKIGSRQGILDLLRGESGTEISRRGIRVARTPRLEIEVHWQPTGPLMVKAAEEGIGIDSLPLASGVEGKDKMALVLPGSAIKGCLRSQSERIVRTLVPQYQLPDEPDAKKRFLTQLAQIPIIQSLYGAAGKKESATSSAEDDLLGLSPFASDDCYGTTSFSKADWRSVVSAMIEQPPGRFDQRRESPTPFNKRLADMGLSQWTAAFHVAIDRWTGGAAESLLYTVLEPHAAKWEPLRFSVDLNRWRNLDGTWTPAQYLPQLALLLLTLRDLTCGKIPLGFATNRGMGELQVESLRFLGEALPAELQSLSNHTLAAGNLSELDGRLLQILQSAWTQWLSNVRSTIS